MELARMAAAASARVSADAAAAVLPSAVQAAGDGCLRRKSSHPAAGKMCIRDRSSSIKKGESNLPQSKDSGTKKLQASNNNGDIAIDFLPQ